MTKNNMGAVAPAKSCLYIWFNIGWREESHTFVSSKAQKSAAMAPKIIIISSTVILVYGENQDMKYAG